MKKKNKNLVVIAILVVFVCFVIIAAITSSSGKDFIDGFKDSLSEKTQQSK
jgi:hypothetical protein